MEDKGWEKNRQAVLIVVQRCTVWYKENRVFSQMAILSGAIHLWHACLSDLLQDPAWIRSRLDSEDTARCARIRLPQAAKHFAACRAFVKDRLSLYSGIEPQAIHFTYGSFGKPFFAPQPFSLAKTPHRVVVALAETPDCGVDMEETTAFSQNIFEAFLHDAERKALAVLPKTQQSHALRTLWVRKEAVIKACGTSILSEAQTLVASPLTSCQRVRRLTPHGFETWLCPLFDLPNAVIACAYPENTPLVCSLHKFSCEFDPSTV